MLSLSLVLFGIVALLYSQKQRSNVNTFLKHEQNTSTESTESAVNMGFLTDISSFRRWLDTLAPTLDMLGSRATMIITCFVLGVTGAAVWVNSLYLHFNPFIFPLSVLVFSLLVGWLQLRKRRRAEFEETFPDALNMMMSAVTAGDSIMQAIIYVGNTLDNKVGREFKRMGDRLRLGESPTQVFNRATIIYPYPAFLFFIVTIQANMARGGQLKPVMARLIRVLVEARNLEKKKMAMTSEARLSAKIVAAIPFGFMVMLSFLNPQNVDFVLHDPEGRMVLYYVVGSEAIGLGIVWMLVKAVR
ncbi:type II secretion system F family protein [Veronia pacifica]|uniref:Type II secretion system protein F n=1 Tax=Veronia pacifica TaxID=1080227 RepID=A0A1C3ES34_9GAMM|nr:type II secretion system F family protein [Veronia pacifica]ODA36079.1 type II secretion system protein F [Veronia pacifica]